MPAGTIIRTARQNLGLTQSALGRRLDVSIVSVGAWERGDYGPHHLRLGAIEAALDLAPGTLSAAQNENDAPEGAPSFPAEAPAKVTSSAGSGGPDGA